MSRSKTPLSLLVLLAIGAVAACAPNGTTPTAASQPTAGPTTAPGTGAASASAVPSPGPSATAAPAPKRYAVRNLDWKEDATDTRLGTAIAQVDYEGGLDEDNDGDYDHRARSEVTVGGQTHTVAFIENDKPLMSDEDDVTLIQDETTGEKLTFASDQEFNSFSVRRGAEKLTVEFDADGRVLVNGQAAASLEEAATLLASSSVGADCSLHSLTFLQGVLERREAEATRGNPSCMIAGSTSRDLDGDGKPDTDQSASYRLQQADEDTEDDGGEDTEEEDDSDDDEAEDLEDLSDAELEKLEKELDALESELTDLLAELESFDEDLEDDEEAEDAQDLAETHLNTNANLASQLVAEVIAKRLGK